MASIALFLLNFENLKKSWKSQGIKHRPIKKSRLNRKFRGLILKALYIKGFMTYTRFRWAFFRLMNYCNFGTNYCNGEYRKKGTKKAPAVTKTGASFVHNPIPR